jgi:hypothetical protein
MAEPETFEEAISLVKFVRTCIADKIMSVMRNPQGGTAEVEQDQLFMWRKLLNQALGAIEAMERQPAAKDGD